MGDKNQDIYLKKYMPKVSGPVLEIGSKDYGNTSSFRDFYLDSEYIGIDMEGGKNVDHVLDLTQGIGDLPRDYFALGVCCSVLEHVRKPWVMAENISAVIRPGGSLYISVPWVWRYHAYPADYYRFSWKGIMELFPDFDWHHIYYSTNLLNEFYEITDETIKADHHHGTKRLTLKGKRKYLPNLMI
ncbi:MAG: class I SAM-dependent methyltransferase, partial [Draconibacterium sp.]|nr:class I SAM-dependent methyltransferase [Draconibacterium sp.]